MPLTGYISEAVAGGALICLWAGIRGHRKEMLQTISTHKAEVESVTDRAFDEIAKIEEKAMTNKDHANICKINTLEVKAHISEEMKSLGQMLFLKMDVQAREQGETLNKIASDVKDNRRFIEKLDRRTVHLKDVDR